MLRGQGKRPLSWPGVKQEGKVEEVMNRVWVSVEMVRHSSEVFRIYRTIFGCHRDRGLGLLSEGSDVNVLQGSGQPHTPQLVFFQCQQCPGWGILSEDGK